MSAHLARLVVRIDREVHGTLVGVAERLFAETKIEYSHSAVVRGLIAIGLATVAGNDTLAPLFARTRIARGRKRGAPLARWSACRYAGRPRTMEQRDEASLEWAVKTHRLGSFCVYALLQALERGAAVLSIDPGAWENTLHAVEWTLTQHVLGHIYAGAHVTGADVERAIRLRVLGSEALAGGPRAADLQSLAERCLALLSGPTWRRALARFPLAIHVYPPWEEG